MASSHRSSTSASRPLASIERNAGPGLGGVADQPLPGLGLDDHHADAVRNDVVQFPGDASPFLGDRRARLLFPVALEPRGPVLQQGNLAAPLPLIASDGHTPARISSEGGERVTGCPATMKVASAARPIPPPSSARRSAQWAATE